MFNELQANPLVKCKRVNSLSQSKPNPREQQTKNTKFKKKSEFQGIMPASIPNTPSSPYQVRNQGACTSAIYLVQNQEGCKERNRTVCLVSAKGGYQGWNLQRSKRRISLCSMNPVENRKTPRRSPEPGDSIAPSSSTQLSSPEHFEVKC